MRKRCWKHKTLPMIAASVDTDGKTALVRVNRYPTFLSPIELSWVKENFDECSQQEYDIAFFRFPDRSDGSWTVDIVTCVEKRAMQTTLEMSYDGPADDNPYVPRAGDVVARCAHNPRPLHRRIHAASDRPVVDGTAVEWVNLCRTCKDVTNAQLFTLYTWTEKDVERVRVAGSS